MNSFCAKFMLVFAAHSIHLGLNPENTVVVFVQRGTGKVLVHLSQNCVVIDTA